MSATRCEHGVVVSDTVGEYRCWDCDPLRVDDIEEIVRNTIQEFISEEAIELLNNLKPCDECGVVFKNSYAYGEHACPGRQGR